MSFGWVLLAAVLWELKGAVARTGTTFVGIRGSFPGRFRAPIGIAQAPGGDVLIADTDNHRVQRCTPTGSCRVVAGNSTPGKAMNQVHFPYGVAVSSDDTLFVVDTFNDRVMQWENGATEGVVVMSNNFTSNGTVFSGLNELSYPVAVALDEQRGYMYVVDNGQHRIRRYNIDFESKNVTSKGVTVAGKDGESGRNLTHLDNPIDIALHPDTGSLWIADSRNYRVVRWAENATAGTLEYGNMEGKPYGVFLTDTAMFVADSGACKVVKKFWDGTVKVVAGGSGCGDLNSQLRFPSGLFVSFDGTIYISDTQNDRIMQWFPTPRPVGDVICYFNDHCSFVLQDGEPGIGNRLIIVNKSDDVFNPDCGRDCADSMLAGANWSSIAHPEGDWLSDMTYTFGTPQLGDYGQYYLCWGPAPNLQDLAAGNCEGVPHVMGVITILPNVYPDENATRSTSQCVKGGRCFVDIWGYAFPEGTVENPNNDKGKGTEALTPPDSAPGNNVVCGSDPSANFVGYRDFVSVNPAQTVGFRRPYAGNLTSIATVDFNLALVIGRQSLCLCYDGSLCFAPWLYGSYGGTMLTRGTVGGELWVCRLNMRCSVVIQGQFLKETDMVGLVSWEAPCSDLLKGNVSNVASVAMPPNSPSSDHSIATVDFGFFGVDGRYKICYCATYEDPRDDDKDTCSSPIEYTQDAGALSIIRVLPKTYECPVSRPCVVTVSGVDLSQSHRLLVGDGDPEVCGFAGVVEYSFIFGIEIRSNYYAPLASPASGTQQTFRLDTFTSASPKSACYCPDYDQQVPFITLPPAHERKWRRLADGACNDPIEFYQPIGKIVTRGPAATEPPCTMGRSCNFSVLGIDLSLEDRMMLCPHKHRCGAPEVCVLPEGPRGLLSPSADGSDLPASTLFSLGLLPLGLYEVCYCAPGDPSSPSSFPCAAPADLTMQAVLLRVKGARAQQRLSCILGHVCTITVRGLDLSTANKLQVASPLASECGNASLAEAGLFVPSAEVNASLNHAQGRRRRGSLEGREELMDFKFNETNKVGRYRMCYCVEGDCLNAQDFFLDAGVLFVKGLVERYRAARCTLGQECSFEARGIGLEQGRDGMQIVPTYLGCGGSQVIVSGAAVNMNGIYDRGLGLVDTKPWYRSRAAATYIFYDLLNFRWIMGPALNANVPNAQGWAWVEDLRSQDRTPDRVPPGNWRVWSGERGEWVVEAMLEVGRVSVPADEIAVNPSSDTFDRVPDPFVDAPWLISERFRMGRAMRLSSYLICYCPAVDLEDRDDRSCSGDDEFLVPDGMLLIEVVRGNERHHCEHYEHCTIRTVLPELVKDLSPLLVLLLPADGRCNQGPFNMSAAWPSAMNVSGELVGAEGTFRLGGAMVAGSFQICLCTAFDDRGDGIPCSEPQEFYQQIGTLTVMPAVRLSYEYGREATLNLTRGLGLNTTDSLRIVQGDSCASPEPVILSLKPDSAGTDGGWAAYVLGRSNTVLSPGYYSACLCAEWDSGDAYDTPCDESSEFLSKVAVITVNIVSSPELTTKLSSTLELEVEFEENATRRLLSTSMVNDPIPVRSRLLNFALATAVADSIQFSLESLLGSTSGSLVVPPETIDLVPSHDFQQSGSVKVVMAGFTARLAGSLEGHLRNGNPCPPTLRHPPWNNTGNAPAPTPTTLSACLSLGSFVADDRSFVFELDAQLGSRAAVLPGIATARVRRLLHGVMAPELSWEPPPSPCINGMPCSALVASSGGLLKARAGLLILEDERSLCGRLPPPRRAENASARGAAGFPENPAQLPRVATLAQEREQRAALGRPGRSGVFAACYCWPPSPCALDIDFYQRAGTITVRGTLEGLEFPCTSFTSCSFTVAGVGLTAWDRLMVVPWASHCDYTAQALDRIERNPAAPASVVGVVNGSSFRRFDIGSITRVGKYRVCYCASNSLSARSAGLPLGPCAYAGDYSMTGGTLWARGVDSSSFTFSCVKDDINTEPCALMLTGRGLLPGADALLLAPLGGECGAVSGEQADVFDPNPVVLEAGKKSTAWFNGTTAVSAARWRVRAKRLGSYKVCFCPRADGGVCERETDFFHPAGVLSVRGAVGDEVFICRATDRCTVRIKGVGLSMRDKVKIINGDQFCDWAGAGSDEVELNPTPVVRVSDDLRSARFDLGVVQAASARVFVMEPLTLRICYCASHNIDNQGPPCSDGADFTHSAGIINTVVCPKPPQVRSFNPPVENVYELRGDPHVRLFSIPQHACDDEGSRTLEDLQGFSGLLAEGGRTEFNDSRRLVTRSGQCRPNLPAGAATMNMMASRATEITFLGAADDGGTRLQGGDGVRLRVPNSLHAVMTILDTRGQGHTCPTWEVVIVPWACDGPAATVFGLLLHAAILVAVLIYVVSSQIGAIVKFIKALRQQAWGATADLVVQERPADVKAAAAQAAVSPGSPQRAATLVGSQCPKLAEEDKSWERNKLAPVLSDAGWAFCIALMRLGAFAAHLGTFVALELGNIPDLIMFAALPGAVIATVLLLQFLVIARALGCRSACSAILAPAPRVAAAGQAEEKPERFAVPPLLHSAAAVAKLHLDMSLPALAKRHHCELWRVALVLLFAIIVVQVVLPLIALIYNFLSPRRDIPASVIPLALTVFGTLAGDEDMLGPEPLGLDQVAEPQGDFTDGDSVISRLSKLSRISSRRSVWSLASAGRQSLQRLTERLGVARPPSQESASGGLRPLSDVQGEEEVAKRKERERKRTLRKAAKEALAERASRAQPAPRSRAAVQPVPEAEELEESAGDEEEAWESEGRERCGCLRRLRDNLCDPFFANLGWLWWRGLVLASPSAPCLREEAQRHRAVGLYAFMEASGFHVAAQAARETVEHISGVSVKHMEGRWTMLYSLVGGLDLTAMHAFVAVAYAPRLSLLETWSLVAAVLVGLFQASRPGTGQALLWLLDRSITGPVTAGLALAALASWRLLASAALSWGCPYFAGSFAAWSCSVLCLELPLFLLWRRYRVLPWLQLRRRVQVAVMKRLCVCCPCRRRRAKVAALVEKAEEVETEPKDRPEESAALLSALKALEEALPEGLRMVLAEEEGGDVQELRLLAQTLFRLPPPSHNLAERVRRLADMDNLLRSLALKLMDEDKACRRAFNDVLRLADEKLYRLRLAADATRVAHSLHFRMGTLENRAELAAEALPDAPQIWVLHWATLLSLGRIPDAGETEHLVLAEEAGREYPGEAVLVPVIHRPRRKEHPDPHGVTCRQLVTFAKWYREKHGLNLEVFFWIDYCCFPEIIEVEQEAQADGVNSVVSGTYSKQSVSMLWSLPGSRNSTLSDLSKLTRYSSSSARFSRASKSSRFSRLSKAPAATYKTTVRDRGLKNLQAWFEEGADDQSQSALTARSQSSGSVASMGVRFRDRKSIISGFSDGASSLILKGRSSKKLKAGTFKTLSDLQKMKRHKDRGRMSTFSTSPQRQKQDDSPLHRLGLAETVADVNREMLRDGSDLVRLLVFAAADAVVVCEAHDSESSTWVRLGLSLAYAFAPTGQFVYLVGRNLVHISRSSQEPKKEQPKGAGFVPNAPVAKLALPVTESSFPALEDRGSDGSFTPPPVPTSVAIVSGAQGETCAWREAVPEFMEKIVVTRQDHLLADPTEWSAVEAVDTEERARILRLAALCLDRPTTLSVGGYQRPPLEFGRSAVHVLRLEGNDKARRQWRKAVYSQRLGSSVRRRSKDDSSSSSADEEEVSAPFLKTRPASPGALEEAAFTYHRPVLDIPKHTRQHYFTGTDEPPPTASKQRKAERKAASKEPAKNGTAKDAGELLRQAADMRESGGHSAPKQLLHPLPTLQKVEAQEELTFHYRFHSSNILVGSNCRTVEQFRPKDAITGKQHVGSPGMAVVAQPLKAQSAVCPDKYKARGVSFDVKVEAVNAGGWKDGLGIGFTAQDPEEWPEERHVPRHAAQVPRTCTCGYSGRWMLEGRSELVHSLAPGQGAWEPGSVGVGDVVTAVLAAPPADVMRVLVNGRLVAERPALSSGLPDPAQEMVWGIIELDGACARVRLGAGETPQFAADLTELAARSVRTDGT